MKAIIYAGIALFSAASVYGVVDYYNSKNNGTLDKIYTEETPAIVAEKEPLAITPLSISPEINKDETPVKATAAKTNKKKVKKSKVFIRDLKFSNFSRGRIIPSKVMEEEKTVAPVKEETKE